MSYLKRNKIFQSITNQSKNKFRTLNKIIYIFYQKNVMYFLFEFENKIIIFKYKIPTINFKINNYAEILGRFIKKNISPYLYFPWNTECYKKGTTR